MGDCDFLKGEGGGALDGPPDQEAARQPKRCECTRKRDALICSTRLAAALGFVLAGKLGL
jgi:hypothetical protein